MQLFINNWSAVLTAPAAAAAVTLSVPLADAAKLTGLGGGDHYLLTLAALDGAGIEIAWEIVKVTGAAAGVLTVQRAQEGTAAREWTSASVISARATKGTFEALRAAGGVVVGNSSPQQLGTPAAGTATAASREDHVHAKPSAADIGAATAAQGAKADTAVQPAALTSGLAGKVDKDGTKVLSDQNYSSAEKAKLAGLEGAHFKGLHASLAALQAAHPSAVAGDYTDVDSGAGADVTRYIWDVSDSKWVIQSGASGSMTAAQIKTAYESNPDTNAYSDAEQAKLAAIAPSATANAADAALRSRSTHTGSQLASTISDFATTVLGTVLTGLSLANAAAGTATDTVLVFLGKLQAQITGLATTMAGKQETLVSGTTIKTVNGSSLLGAGNLVIAGVGDMANPMTTVGDLICGGAAGTPVRVPAGTEADVMTMVGGAPAWTPLGTTTTSVRVYSEEPISPVPYQLFMIVPTPDIVGPAVTAFTATSGVASPVPVTAFAATDGVGVTAYWIGETSSTPGLDDAGWASSPQTSYTTSSVGTITLYARARDAAGNISSAVSQVVSIVAPENFLTVSWPYDSGVHTSWLSSRTGGADTVWGAQSFTTVGAITVSSVDATVRSRKDEFAGAGGLRMRIVDNNAGQPGTTTLGSATLSDFTSPSNGFVSKRFTLDSPVSLSAGTKYWLVLDIVSPVGDCCYQWAYGPSDAYAGGNSSVMVSGSWGTLAGDQVCRLAY